MMAMLRMARDRLSLDMESLDLAGREGRGW